MAEAAPSRLYVPGLPGTGETLELSGDESRYLRRVCRAKVGDRASATDGAGVAAQVRVTAIGTQVRVEVESTWRVPRLHEAWVLCGAPEGQRADWLVEKLAELGVSVLQPIDCERGAWERRSERGERFRKLAVAALRQSRRAWVMEIGPTVPLAEAVNRVPKHAPCWVASAEAPRAASNRQDGAGTVGSEPADLEVVAVGPAGGFTDPESALLIGRGFLPIRLSDARLRTETAALAWAANWSCRLPIASS